MSHSYLGNTSTQLLEEIPGTRYVPVQSKPKCGQDLTPVMLRNTINIIPNTIAVISQYTRCTTAFATHPKRYLKLLLSNCVYQENLKRQLNPQNPSHT